MTRVSVVVPAWNAERFVHDSITSALVQTLPPIECIVVDGGSTDRTREIVRAIDDPRVRLVQQRGAGPAAARNDGIAIARGDAIAFLDADDVWHPRKLERQVARLDASPGLGLVGCSYAIVDATLRPITEIRAADQDVRGWLLLEGNGLALTSTGLFPTAVLTEVGGFDAALRYSGDLDLAVRVAVRRPVAIVDGVLVAYRSHPRQLHLDGEALERDAGVILDRELGATPRLHRRAAANLQTRLLCYDIGDGRWRAGLARLPAIAPRLDRFVALPLGALHRRARRRLRARKMPLQTWRPPGTTDAQSLLLGTTSERSKPPE